MPHPKSRMRAPGRGLAFFSICSTSRTVLAGEMGSNIACPISLLKKLFHWSFLDILFPDDLPLHLNLRSAVYGQSRMGRWHKCAQQNRSIGITSSNSNAPSADAIVEMFCP